MSKNVQLRGTTWGHRRAIDPLIEASRAYAQTYGAAGVRWSIRDLTAFEHQPLADAMSDCDLLIFDHPFVGEIAASGLFLPLDDVLFSVTDGAIAESYAGPSLDSYRWSGKLWGAPVDAATMHGVLRPDLLARMERAAPTTWSEVVALGRVARKHGLWLGVANGDHHGFLAIGSMMHNRGHSWTTHSEVGLQFDLAAFAEALEQLDEVTAFAHPGCGAFNAIALQDAMSSRDDIVYCPLTFGYATYGEADHGARRLGFAPAPGMREPYCAGTLLGGAGVGLSASCTDMVAAKAFVAFLLSPKTQSDIFARHHGQPACASCWVDPVIDDRFNGYFLAVGDTIRQAAIRPRFKGYGQFEKLAGNAVGAFLRKERGLEETLSGMSELVERHGAINGLSEVSSQGNITGRELSGELSLQS